VACKPLNAGHKGVGNRFRQRTFLRHLSKNFFSGSQPVTTVSTGVSLLPFVHPLTELVHITGDQGVQDIIELGTKPLGKAIVTKSLVEENSIGRFRGLDLISKQVNLTVLANKANRVVRRNAVLDRSSPDAGVQLINASDNINLRGVLPRLHGVVDVSPNGVSMDLLIDYIGLRSRDSITHLGPLLKPLTDATITGSRTSNLIIESLNIVGGTLSEHLTLTGLKLRSEFSG